MFSDIDRMFARGENAVLMAIDEQCASGKTTLAALVQQAYDRNLFHMDDFFLMRSCGLPNVWPKWAKMWIMRGLGSRYWNRYSEEQTSVIRYDCGQQKLTTWVDVPAKQLNLVEGAYRCHPYFGSCYHFLYCLH